MKNILIIGALPKNPKQLIVYETIIDVCEELTADRYDHLKPSITSPIDTMNFKWTDTERSGRAYLWVADADIVIAEQSKPSTWAWMEIQMCFSADKPVIVVAKKWSAISWLVKWHYNVGTIIYYKSLEDLKLQLFNSLDKYIE